MQGLSYFDFCCKGIVNLCPAEPQTTGGFVCIPRSHSEDFQKEICAALGGHRLRKRGDFLPLDEMYRERCVGIQLDPGDLLLWDSRIVHGSEPAPGLEGGLEGTSEAFGELELLRMAVPAAALES